MRALRTPDPHPTSDRRPVLHRSHSVAGGARSGNGRVADPNPPAYPPPTQFDPSRSRSGPSPPGPAHDPVPESDVVSELSHLNRLLRDSADRNNPPPEIIREILVRSRVIAVVGLSRDPTKAARRVPSYLATKGYDVIPVNPFADRILGRPAVPSLADVAETVDLVLVFRPPEQAEAVVDSAAARPERPVIWLQEGITAPAAAARARAGGRTVIQDLCIFKAHRALELSPAPQAGS
jgi:uncharacterized protein